VNCEKPEAPRAPDGSAMLTTAEKAVELGCAVPTLWKRVRAGVVPKPVRQNVPTGTIAWFLSEASIELMRRPKRPKARAPSTV